nr:hypothetical protein [Xanthomonas prunicola]
MRFYLRCVAVSRNGPPPAGGATELTAQLQVAAAARTQHGAAIDTAADQQGAVADQAQALRAEVAGHVDGVVAAGERD